MATIRNKNAWGKRGSALLLVLIMLTVLSISGAGFLRLGLQARTLAARTSNEIAARCAADAGMTRALYEMNRLLLTQPWNESSLPQAQNFTVPGTDATYSYTVFGDSHTGFTTQAFGAYAGTQRRVISSLKLEKIHGHPIFATELISVQRNSIIDSYNSLEGPYSESNRHLSVDVGTDATGYSSVRLSENATIYGDLTIGHDADTEGVVNLGAGSNLITGDISDASSTMSLPLISPPDLDYVAAEPSGTVTTSGTYDNIAMNNESLVIDGDVILNITGGISLDNNSSIMLTEGSTLTIYCAGPVAVKNGSGIADTSVSPCDIKIYGTSEMFVDYRIHDNSVVFGSLYAPNADLAVYNSSHLFGEVASRQIRIDNNSGIHYDRALENCRSVTEPNVQFALTKWREDSVGAWTVHSYTN